LRSLPFPVTSSGLRRRWLERPANPVRCDRPAYRNTAGRDPCRPFPRERRRIRKRPPRSHHAADLGIDAGADDHFERDATTETTPPPPSTSNGDTGPADIGASELPDDEDGLWGWLVLALGLAAAQGETTETEPSAGRRKYVVDLS
jgi:hypothetical protein